MAAQVAVGQIIGPNPGTIVVVSSTVFNRDDTPSGTTIVPCPSATGTAFSFRKSYQFLIVNANGHTLSNLRVGKASSEPTGLKYWYIAANTFAQYTQVGGPIANTSDNNVTAPVLRTVTCTAMATIGSASIYDSGSYTAVWTTSGGGSGKLIEAIVGVDNTAQAAGGGLKTLPNMVFRWTEV